MSIREKKLNCVILINVAQNFCSPSGVWTSVSTSQTHEDGGSTQSHTRRSNITLSENKESRIILTYQDKLINVISANALSIAGILLGYEFISDEVSSRKLNLLVTP